MKGLPAVALLLAATTSAAAAPARTAYVDEIVIAGGVDSAQARDFTVVTLRSGGMESRFSDGTLPGCGDTPRCLVDRARSAGTTLAVRITIVAVGADVVVSMLAADTRGTIRRELVASADLSRSDDRLASSLRELAPPAEDRSRAAAWSLVGIATSLAIGGSLATWHAHDLRSEFYADHIESNGDVVGISPADARAEERSARRWSYAGGIALGAAALGGVGATILFVRSAGTETPSAGVTLAWRIP